MKKSLLTFVSLALLLGSAFAQPNFTSSDMPNIGDGDTLLFKTYTGSISNLDTETGNDYVWDFSDLVFFHNIYNVDSFRVKTNPISIPYEDATIEHYSQGASGIGVSLYDYSNDTLFIHRLGAGGAGTAFVPPLASIKFPIQFNQMSDITSSIYIAGNLAGERQTTTLYDGFGTLHLLGNTYNEVFRIKKVERDTNFVLNMTTTYINYIWYKKGGQVPLLRITNSVGTNYYAHASLSSEGTIGIKDVNSLSNIQVYPNPTTDVIRLDDHQIGIVKIELVDINGRQLKVFGSNERKLNISDLQCGMYFLIIETEQAVESIKILKH